MKKSDRPTYIKSDVRKDITLSNLLSYYVFFLLANQDNECSI